MFGRRSHVFRGIRIHPHTPYSSMGMRWWALTAEGRMLRSDTLRQMRSLIRRHLAQADPAQADRGAGRPGARGCVTVGTRSR